MVMELQVSVSERIVELEGGGDGDEDGGREGDLKP